MRDYWPDLPAWKLWKAQLYQESQLDPSVCSAAGACGIAQFMPGSWETVIAAGPFHGTGASRFDAKTAIAAGAFYQSKLRRSWLPSRRTPFDQNDLGAASYNSGLGNIIAAQRRCGEAIYWSGIAPCLEQVTGVSNANQTTTYVRRINQFFKMMEATP